MLPQSNNLVLKKKVRTKAKEAVWSAPNSHELIGSDDFVMVICFASAPKMFYFPLISFWSVYLYAENNMKFLFYSFFMKVNRSEVAM